MSLQAAGSPCLRALTCVLVLAVDATACSGCLALPACSRYRQHWQRGFAASPWPHLWSGRVRRERRAAGS